MSDPDRLPGFRVVRSLYLPPRTAYLLSEGGSLLLLVGPPALRWWREPRRWLRQRRLGRRAARERARRREMKAWLALYRPDLRLVRWGRLGGAVVAPRVDLPEGRVVTTTLAWDGSRPDRALALAEMRVAMALLDPRPRVPITDLA